MSRTRTRVFATVLALALLVTPAAQAASIGTEAGTRTTPSKISPHNYDDFQAGVSGHRYQMEGAEQVFTQTANSLRTAAKEIEPLIGQEDSLSKAALETQLTTVANDIQTIEAVSKASKSMFDKACDRFLKQHVKSWSTTKEKNKVRKNVEAMRDAYHQFFDKNYKDLHDAAVKLGDKDVAGFWRAPCAGRGWCRLHHARLRQGEQEPARHGLTPSRHVPASIGATGFHQGGLSPWIRLMTCAMTTRATTASIITARSRGECSSPRATISVVAPAGACGTCSHVITANVRASASVTAHTRRKVRSGRSGPSPISPNTHRARTADRMPMRWPQMTLRGDASALMGATNRT